MDNLEKKLCLPGTYLASCEEFVPGDNTYVDNDGIYAAIMGEPVEDRRRISVANPKKELPQIREGTQVLCKVVMMKESKAIMECAPETKERRFSIPIMAALPVQNVKRGYVKSLREELRIGDVVKAVVAVAKPAVDVSIVRDDLGVIVAFCRKCRHTLDLGQDNRLHCANCGMVDQRKIASTYRGKAVKMNNQ